MTNKSDEVDNFDDAKLKDLVENKDVAAASYFLILSPILLLTRKDSDFIQHHSRQALALFLIFMFLWFLGTFYIFFAWTTIGVFFVALVGFTQAINGKYYEIPYIYEYVKDGYSIELFLNIFKKSFAGLKEIITGLFPKNSFQKTKQVTEGVDNSRKINETKESEKMLENKLEKKIERLEKRIIELENKNK
ncbi:TPA: hypothetical protein EYG96_01235 [Candidatus Gracilibacteria bacterium]|nr:hypothetical protein [Candidatus Peregrinibacteria bacterium]HIQ56645.1 hypothetical protein [Candidatus Gracilibacteria bacterium]HIQ57151.1 hypothetical protein [Candidatus Gracilibacteria bacterium]